MILRRLSLVNFKNIEAETLDFSSGLNCLVGENGAGKTNVLDAVHYLSMCRSSLGGTDRQALRHGGEFFMVEGEYTADAGHDLKVVCGFSPDGGKKMKCGGKEYERLSDHFGVVPAVMVSPSDVFLISDAADERRRWLNIFISSLDRTYMQALVRYNAVLAERNKLLKELYSPGHAGILDALDVQLAAHGDKIHARRAEIIDRIRPLVASYYARLSDDREQVEMTYRSHVTDVGMAEVLVAAREKDTVNNFTTSGIHRDEVVMRIGGDPLRRYGSQGQQKSFLVALKLAQFGVVRAVTGETPILLLDDLFDKLDVGRVERLISLVSGDGGEAEGLPAGQIFISDCNREHLEGIFRRGGRDYSLFVIENGKIIR
ncbi:MAG: DNA replication and repair protein RecF [Alistipes sp.]|nr:DNA replication and repair protein RecF [Alistipes sp.]